MRNLKRVLALALALVMMLGMMITASAATYTDDAAIDGKYADAVEVLSGMGLFKGQSTTAKVFAPKAILTRAEAAALIYRAITGDVADKQVDLYDYTSFADVQEGAWYTPYITYAANGGYIKGYAGNAMPNDTVTGIQVIAIMLRAAGYGQNGEYEGAAWKDNILTDAQELGITKGLATNDLDKAATRELVAQLIFNAMTKAYMVTYTPALGYVPYTMAGAKNGAVGRITLAEKVFDLNSVAGEDNWGRPSTIWYAETYAAPGETTAAYTFTKETKYAEIAQDPDATYVVATSECDIAKDLGLRADADIDTITVNGYEYTAPANNKINLTAMNKIGAQGQLVEFYYNVVEKNYDVVIIDTYLAEVTDVTEVEYDKNGHIKYDAELDLDVFVEKISTDADDWTTAPITLTDDENWEYAVGDMLLVYVHTDSSKSEVVAYAETMVGAQTAYTTKDSHIVEDTEYADAVEYQLDEAQDYTTDYTWYFDLYGNLIGSTKIYSKTTFGTISSIYWKDSNNGDDGVAIATITYMDGTSETAIIYSINDIELEGVEGQFWADYGYGWVASTKQYNEDEFANVALYEIETGKDGLELTECDYLENATTETGRPALTADIDAGKNTMFLVWNPKTEKYETYTGIKNVPTYIDGDFWYYDGVRGVEDKVAEYVFIIDPTAESTSAEQTFYWDQGLIKTTHLKNSSKQYYTLTGGYVNGTEDIIKTKDAGIVTTLMADASKGNLFVLGLTDGYVTSITEVTNLADEIGRTKAYAVYAGAVDAAKLSAGQEVLTDGAGNSYYIEDATVISSTGYNLATTFKKDQENTLKDAQGNVINAYIYVVYTQGTNFTKTAQYVYLTTAAGVGTAVADASVNVSSIAVKGAEAEFTGGKGTQGAPFTYVADIDSTTAADATAKYLEVIAKSTSSDIEIHWGSWDGTEPTGTNANGVATDDTTGAWTDYATGRYYWYVIVDGVYYKVDIKPVVTTFEVDTAADLIAAAAAAGEGDTVTLTGNVAVTAPVEFNAKNVTLDLAGYTLGNTTDIYNTTTKVWSLISVQGGSLTIKGEGTVAAKENDCYAVDVRGGAELTIENGTFVGNIAAVYVHTGKATIKGGEFSIQQLDTTHNDARFTLNCYDANYAADTANIVVTGGTFTGFNPADNLSEGADTCYVDTTVYKAVLGSDLVSYTVVAK